MIPNRLVGLMTWLKERAAANSLPLEGAFELFIEMREQRIIDNAWVLERAAAHALPVKGAQQFVLDAAAKFHELGVKLKRYARPP